MRISAAALLCGAALAAGALTASVVARAPAVYADAIDDKIAELKTLEKDEGKCVSKMEELKESIGDQRVMNAIKKLADCKSSDKIAAAAMKMVANHEPADVEFLKWMLGKVDDKDLYETKGRPDVYKAMLEAIASPTYKKDKNAVITVKKAQPAVMKLIDKFKTTNGDYAGRLVAVYGMVADAFTVADLLKLGEELDSGGKSGGGGGGGGGAGGGKSSADATKHKGETKKAVIATLNAMTGQDIADVTSWKKFWDEKGKTFKFPELGSAPPTPAAAAAVEPLAPEYKDAGYEFSMKRPTTEGWTWVKSDFEGPRAVLSYSKPDDAAYLLARAYISIHPAAKVKPHNAKDFAEWCKDPTLKQQLDTHDKEPTVEIKKFGGYDWTVVSAKGDGLDVKKGWGTMERRFYIVEIEPNILWIDAYARNAETDIKNELWAAIESMTLPPKKK